jgi:nucleoside-diphosphate-sugar epimerase
MKVLITGGTGFIGSRLALNSIERGHNVVVLGQTNTTAEKENIASLEAAGVKVIYGAVTDKDIISEAVNGCDMVFHLAAAQHEANVPDQYFYDVNVEGTRNVIDASIQFGVKRFLHGSTIGIYGSAMNGVIDENTSPSPNNIYGVTKLKGEQLALTYADKIPLTVIRISETYGDGDRRLLKLFKAIKKQLFFMIGNGKNIHQLIHVNDLIDGMYQAIENDVAIGEVFVLAGNEELSTNDMVKSISTAINKPQRKFSSPLWPFLIAAIILEKTLSPLGIQPPLHRRRLDFFRKSFFFSQEKTKNLLGFTPKINFEQGALMTAQWYEKNNLL